MYYGGFKLLKLPSESVTLSESAGCKGIFKKAHILKDLSGSTSSRFNFIILLVSKDCHFFLSAIYLVKDGKGSKNHHFESQYRKDGMVLSL